MPWLKQSRKSNIRLGQSYVILAQNAVLKYRYGVFAFQYFSRLFVKRNATIIATFFNSVEVTISRQMPKSITKVLQNGRKGLPIRILSYLIGFKRMRFFGTVRLLRKIQFSKSFSASWN